MIDLDKIFEVIFCPETNNSSFSNFISDCKKLVSKLINQCFSAAALRKRFEAFIDKHFYVWGKFGVPLSVNHVSWLM